MLQRKYLLAMTPMKVTHVFHHVMIIKAVFAKEEGPD